MKVVLNENVKGLGKKLDIVNVSEGYARNFLFPKKLATPADNKSVSEATTKKSAIQFKKDTDRENAQELKAKIEEIIVDFKVKTADNGKLFGSVTSKEISDSIDQLNLGNVCNTSCMVAFAELLVELEYTAIRMEKENEL
jgi:large subunit ribosomal protein L9